MNKCGHKQYGVGARSEWTLPDTRRNTGSLRRTQRSGTAEGSRNLKGNNSVLFPSSSAAIRGYIHPHQRGEIAKPIWEWGFVGACTSLYLNTYLLVLTRNKSTGVYICMHLSSVPCALWSTANIQSNACDSSTVTALDDIYPLLFMFGSLVECMLLLQSNVSTAQRGTSFPRAERERERDDIEATNPYRAAPSPIINTPSWETRSIHYLLIYASGRQYTLRAPYSEKSRRSYCPGPGIMLDSISWCVRELPLERETHYRRCDDAA